MSSTFAARFPGYCYVCQSGIEPGDEVFYGVDDWLSHVTCTPAIQPLPDAIVKACGTCFLVLPVSGVCEECES